MKVALSIGLNVGATEPKSQLTRTLMVLMETCTILDLAMHKGAWGGVAERTLQVLVEVPASQSFMLLAYRIAVLLNQECVAALYLPAHQWVHAALMRWTLCYADGHCEAGATVAEFPLHISLERK